MDSYGLLTAPIEGNNNNPDLCNLLFMLLFVPLEAEGPPTISRLKDCAMELSSLLQQEKLAGASLLVFANKQDIPGA